MGAVTSIGTGLGKRRVGLGLSVGQAEAGCSFNEPALRKERSGQYCWAGKYRCMALAPVFAARRSSS